MSTASLAALEPTPRTGLFTIGGASAAAGRDPTPITPICKGMARSVRASILMAGLLAATSPAAAQTVCRPNALGTVTCPAPPPEPRPILRANTQALDRVRRSAAAAEQAPGLIPAWRSNRLGITPTAPGEIDGASHCRADSLGNLRCP